MNANVFKYKDDNFQITYWPDDKFLELYNILYQDSWLMSIPELIGLIVAFEKLLTADLIEKNL